MNYPPMNTEADEDTSNYRDVRPTFLTEGRADSGGGSSSGIGSHTVHQRHRQGHRHHERDSISPSMSGEDYEEFDDDDGDDEDPGREGRRGSYNIDSRRDRQWTGDPYIAAGHASTHGFGATNRMLVDEEVDTRRGNSTMVNQVAAAAVAVAVAAATAGAGSRAQSPRSARRYRNRLAAARMRSRQKQQLVELEKRKSDLERRAAELQLELQDIQRKNNPLNSSIDKLAGMIDDLTKVECTMLTGIDECKNLLQNLEKLYESKQQQQPQK
ncbi:hypothetical protein IW152_004774 [Coemansia sp. BCRC 34962]|nr:hypothetical protein IW152_004774 [Coemansia sp. BCRC 34962]